MKARCFNPKVAEYKYYGGRGITVCDRWLDYDTFAADAAALPGEGDQLDRIDVNGNYDPGNCRWATRTVNQRNQRRSHNITWRGETHHIIEWAKIVGLPHETLRSRVLRRNWPLDRAMTEALNHG